MVFSLGQRLRTTRELLGLTQQQVIEQLKNSYGVTLSQQALSCIENGKRKVDAERELPAIAAVCDKPIKEFYEFWRSPNFPLIRISDRSRKISFFELRFIKCGIG